MTREAPRSKADFQRRYLRGEFGNTLQTWDTLEELLASGFKGLVNARRRQAGGKCLTNLDPQALARAWSLPEAPDAYYFNARAPDDRLILQGELSLTVQGLTLFYDQTPGLTCRQALSDKVPRQAYRLTAQLLLQQHLSPSSYDDIRELLVEYPDGVVEFSAFDCCVGRYPGRNHVIWEVRNY